MSILNKAKSSADLTQPKQEITEVKAHYRKRTRLTTDKLPEDLPVEAIEHELSNEERNCPECGSRLHAVVRKSEKRLKLFLQRL